MTQRPSRLSQRSLASSRVKPPAVLLGLNSMQGLQAARILRRRGVPVSAVATEKSYYTNYTRCCDDIVVADRGEDDVIEALERLAGGFDDKAFLLPCTDGSVRTVSRHRLSLERSYDFVLPPEETVEQLGGKVGLVEFCQEHGLPAPESAVIRSDADLEEALERLAFPAVLKPARRTARWTACTKIKAVKLGDANELRATWAKCRDIGVPVVVQRWIAGDDAALYSCNAYFDRNGEPTASFVAKKLRQWPLEVGQSSLGVECRDDEVLRITLEFFRAARYKGLAYLEIKKELSTGRYFIIEPNIGRPTGRSAIAEAGGVELLLTAYNDALGLPPPPRRTQAYGQAKWIHLRRDTQAAWCAWRAGELTAAGWLRSLQGVNSFAVWSWSDPAPFLMDLWSAARAAASGKERRRARAL